MNGQARGEEQVKSVGPESRTEGESNRRRSANDQSQSREQKCGSNRNQFPEIVEKPQSDERHQLSNQSQRILVVSLVRQPRSLEFDSLYH